MSRHDAYILILIDPLLVFCSICFLLHRIIAVIVRLLTALDSRCSLILIKHIASVLASTFLKITLEALACDLLLPTAISESLSL